MSNFTPHIALSHQYPKLELPMDFQPDNIEILIKGTPEERAVVINTGCVALQALIQKRNEISKGNDYKEGKEEGMKEESKKWQQEKKNIENNNETSVKELKDKLRTLQDENNHQKTTIVTAETRYLTAEAEANAFREREFKKINDTRAEVESGFSHKLKTLTDELNSKKIEAEKAVSELREAEMKFVHDMEKKLSEFRDEEKKLREQLSSESKENYEKQLNEIKSAFQKEIDRQKETIESMTSNLDSANIRQIEELKIAQAAIVKVKDDKFVEIRAAEEKIRQELNPKIEELQNLLNNVTHRQANSSLKDKGNENAFEELLNTSFGSDPNYRKLPKTTESGDFIIVWKEMKFMFENKKYTKTVPKIEVEKAIRDFELNKDCDVLIFVSEDSSIINCKSQFEITQTGDGRHAIWIGEFYRNEDKVVYLQLVGRVAEELVRLQKREKKFENGQKVVDYKNKVDDLIESFKETKVDLDNLLKLQNACQRNQNKLWNKLKNEMVSVIARFKRRREHANGNTDKDEENGVEVNADSEPKAKKRRKTPAKNKLSNKTKVNYFDKSPQRAFQHQQFQQGPSSGFNVDIDQDQANQNYILNSQY